MNTTHSNVFWKENPRFILENHSKLALLRSPSRCAGLAARGAARQAYRPSAGLRPAFPWQRGATGPAPAVPHVHSCSPLRSQTNSSPSFKIWLASLCSTSRCAGSAAQDVVAWRTQIPNLLKIALVSLEHTDTDIHTSIQTSKGNAKIKYAPRMFILLQHFRLWYKSVTMIYFVTIWYSGTINIY